MLARTADNIFWLARYVERAEFTARIIDITTRLAALPKAYGGSGSEWESALNAVGSLESFEARYDTANEANVLDFLIFDTDNHSSIRSCIELARSNARAVRTALTADMWQSINAGWLELHALERARTPGEPMNRARIEPFLDVVKTMSRDFDGMAYRNMLRNDAFYFNRLGLYMERADNTARILDVKYHVLLPNNEPIGGPLDYLQWSAILRSVSALTSYHWVYRDSLRPWRIADLLILNDEMPRSLSSCYDNLVRYLDDIATSYAQQGPAQRRARAMRARMKNLDIEQIFQAGLHQFIQEFLNDNSALGDAITKQYLI